MTFRASIRLLRQEPNEENAGIGELAKLIADPDGVGKPAPKPAPLKVSEAEISRRPGSHWYDWYAAKFARAKNA